MDATKEKTLDEEILNKLGREFNDTVTISLSGYYKDSNGWSDPQYGAVPPLTVSNINGNINGTSYSNISIGQGGNIIGAGSNTYGHVWTTGTSIVLTQALIKVKVAKCISLVRTLIL